MTAIPVECLRCGSPHHLLRSQRSTIDEGECPQCGYLGWTPVPPAATAVRPAAALARARASDEPRSAPVTARARIA